MTFQLGDVPGSVFSLGLFLLGVGLSTNSASGGALENYVAAADTNFAWKKVDQQQSNGFTVTRLELTSQKWREHVWTHHL